MDNIKKIITKIMTETIIDVNKTDSLFKKIEILNNGLREMNKTDIQYKDIESADYNSIAELKQSIIETLLLKAYSKRFTDVCGLHDIRMKIIENENINKLENNKDTRSLILIEGLERLELQIEFNSIDGDENYSYCEKIDLFGKLIERVMFKIDNGFEHEKDNFYKKLLNKINLEIKKYESKIDKQGIDEIVEWLRLNNIVLYRIITDVNNKPISKIYSIECTLSQLTHLTIDTHPFRANEELMIVLIKLLRIYKNKQINLYKAINPGTRLLIYNTKVKEEKIKICNERLKAINTLISKHGKSIELQSEIDLINQEIESIKINRI